MHWSESYRERVCANLGIITEVEQERLRRACVGVAGCGGIGGRAAADLAYWGVGHIKLADFDVFDASNANRQLYAARSTVGKAKIQVVANNIKDISPDIRLELYEQGITIKNADEFVDGCDMVLDAIDYESPKYSLALHRSARLRGVPVFVSQCIGFGASMFAFYPDAESYEEFLGLDQAVSLEDLDVRDIDLKKLCPLTPEYIDPHLWDRVVRGEVEAPVVVAGQTIAVGLTVTEMVIQLSKRGTRRPLRMCAFDALTTTYTKSYESPLGDRDDRGT